ncbi:MAG: hypothetical protein R3F34_10015 [Planctomycetota bacterium]
MRSTSRWTTSRPARTRCCASDRAPRRRPWSPGPTFNTISGLEFVPATTGATFTPFQPQHGGTLRYVTTDFFSTWERYEVRPARPTLSLTGVGVGGPGPFDVVVDAGPANGLALVVYGPQSLYSPVELPIVTGLFAPLFTGLDPFTFLYGPYLPLDAAGHASIGYVNPGTWIGNAAIQAVCVDPLLGIVGTSTTALN